MGFHEFLIAYVREDVAIQDQKGFVPEKPFSVLYRVLPFPEAFSEGRGKTSRRLRFVALGFVLCKNSVN